MHRYVIIGSGAAGIAAEDIGKCAYGIFRRGDEFIGKTVGIAGEHLGGKQMAGVLDIIQRNAAQKRGEAVDEETLSGMKQMIVVVLVVSLFVVVLVTAGVVLYGIHYLTAFLGVLLAMFLIGVVAEAIERVRR